MLTYQAGFAPLSKIPIVRWLGGDQFRKFSIIAMIILVVTVYITCVTQEEKERPQNLERQTAGWVHLTCNPKIAAEFSCRPIAEAVTNVRIAITKLPKPIRRVCFVQLFAFMGW